MSIIPPERNFIRSPFQRLDAVELTGLVRRIAAQPADLGTET